MRDKIANVAKMSSEELHAYRWELTSKTCECTKLKRISSLMQIVQMDEMHSLLHAYMIGVRQNCRNCKNVAFTPRVHDRGEKGIGKYFPSISLPPARKGELMIFAKMPKMDNCPILPFLQILSLSYICYGVLEKQPFRR